MMGEMPISGPEPVKLRTNFWGGKAKFLFFFFFLFVEILKIIHHFLPTFSLILPFE
jgi:hypothetical protein